MWVHGIVILHRLVNGDEGGGIGYWTDPDIVAVEGFHKSLGHAVAFRTSDRGERRARLSAKAILIVLWAMKIDGKRSVWAVVAAG
jgi:hypothetical protein